MRLDRSVADTQISCDLLVGMAADNPQEYLPFARGELIQGMVVILLAPDCRGKTAGNRGTEIRFSPAYRADRITELGSGGVCQQVAVGSRAHALQDVLRVVVHAEDEHSGRTGGATETGSHLETRLIRHGNIQHDYIRPEPGGEGQRFGATGCLADHLEVGLAFYDMSDSGPDDHVVVCDQDPDRFARHAPFDG